MISKKNCSMGAPQSAQRSAPMPILLWILVLPGFLLLLVTACGKSPQDPIGPDVPGTEPVDPEGQEGRGPVSATATPQHLSDPLMENSAGDSDDKGAVETLFTFADALDVGYFRSFGVLVDFGIAYRDKFTLGDWKTGWRGNYVQQGRTVSFMQHAAARAFVRLTAEEAGSGRLVIHARGPAGKTAKGKVYVNGTFAQAVEFSGESFSHQTVNLDQSLREGENEILFRFNKASTVADGKSARLEVDYLRVIPDGQSDGQATVSLEKIVTRSDAASDKQVFLRAGESLTFYLPVEPGARVVGKAHSRDRNAVVKLSATAEVTEAPVVQDLRVPKTGRNVLLNLASFSGDVARIDFRVEEGECIFTDLKIVAPQSHRDRAPGKSAATNVVLVLIDTLRADHLKWHNASSRVQTPFMDRLGLESMIFDRAMAQENWTKPSIASLLTGLYPSTHDTKSDRDKLPHSAQMMPEFFRSLGFATAGFVANGYISSKFDFERGWDTWTNYVREGKRNRAQFVAEDAVAWLKRRQTDKPFFLYVHTIDPHVPYIPPERYRKLYDDSPYHGKVQSTETANLLGKVKTGAVKLSERDKVRLEALYDGEITYHDEHLEKLYDELRIQGLLENTVIAITSDHGEEFYDHDSVGHGHSLYEELVHVPLGIRLPGAAPREAMAHYDEEVQLIDLFPTFCELLGVECSDDLEGRSLVMPLSGAMGSWPDTSFSEFMDGQLAVRSGRFKLIYRGLTKTVFDLENDAQEQSDISEAQPNALIFLRTALGMHMGQFSPGGVIEANQKAPASSGKKRHKAEEAVIDKETRKQLKALGYMND